MADIAFAWTAAKATANKRKHRVSFSEAQTVFYDEDATIRIISARKANARERSIYEKRRNR